MAAELGKLAEAVRPYNPDYADLLSSYSTILLSEGKIPMYLIAAEGKPRASSESDVLSSIATRLKKVGFNEGSDFLRLQNFVFNTTGMLTDEMQKKLIIAARKPFSTDKKTSSFIPKKVIFGGEEIFSTQKVKTETKYPTSG